MLATEPVTEPATTPQPDAATPARKFTWRNVATVKPGRHNAGFRGLSLLVTPNGGVRRWIFRYKSPVTGRITETGLGLVPIVTLAIARTKALELSRMVAEGVDPIHHKREQRSARTTFAEAADAWIEIHRPEWRSESQMRNAKLLLFKHGEQLAALPVSQIDADKIQSALDPLMARSPAQARRTLAMWERVLDYARARGLRQGDNPASWRGMHEYRFPKRNGSCIRHHAAMPYEEVPGFIQQLRMHQGRSTAALALEFLILTTCRTGEVLGAQWSEFDFENRIWTLAPNRTKQGREHRVPLCDRVLELLALQRHFSRGSPFVFTGYTLKQLADKSLSWVLRHMERSDITVHGFRSSFRDFCGNETEFKREHVEESLGHLVGNNTERSYRRRAGLEKRRAILEHWANYCAGE